MGDPLYGTMLGVPNPALQMVKSYLNLITGPDLNPGNGIRKLYVMRMKPEFLNDDSLREAANKYEAMGMLPQNLVPFFAQCVAQNIYTYSQILRDMIYRRMSDIATGAVKNPGVGLYLDPATGRRSYYLPTPNLCRALSKTFDAWRRGDLRGSPVISMSYRSVAEVAKFELVSLEARTGLGYNNQPTFRQTYDIVTTIVEQIGEMASSEEKATDFREELKPALVVLWVIAKMMLGDVTAGYSRMNLPVIGADGVVKLSDALAAAIPMPTNSSVSVFSDPTIPDATRKVKTYLSAVSHYLVTYPAYTGYDD